MSATSTIRIGARRSALSRRQVDLVVELLAAARPELTVDVVVFTTIGDRRLDTPLPEIGGKGVFTEEIEQALLAGRVDLAVHSLKDLPTCTRSGLAIGAVPARAAVEDVLVSRSGLPLARLPSGATVGTSSPRRAAQLLRKRPDLRIASLRGNVETRLARALDPSGELDAIVLARAGLERLALLDRVTETLSPATVLPAPGQGALAVQCRDEDGWLRTLASIDHPATALATAAERAFLTGLGGGCAAPVAALGTFEDGVLDLWGRVISPDGARLVEVRSQTECGSRASAERAGLDLASRAFDAGAAEILARGDGWGA